MPAARPKKENNSATSQSDDVHLKDPQAENSKSKRKYVPNARSFSGLLYTIPLPLLSPFIASHFVISCLFSEKQTTDYFLCFPSGVNHRVCLLPRFTRSSLTFFA